MDQISPDWLERIERIASHWQLGPVQTVTRAARGRNNPIFILNDAYAIRFDGLTGIAESRFAAEQIAYDALTARGLPVPRVIAVDGSLTLAPMEYMVMTKVRGAAVIDTWHTLTPAQQTQMSYQAGQILATMHGITFPKFGRLRKLTTRPLERWVEWVDDFAGRYLIRARAQGTVDPALLARIEAVLIRCRPLLEAVLTPVLVHGDAHWENWLQEDGVITGLVDFEWALAADPSSDFQVEEQWDGFCPGSHDPLYAGYQSLRTLDEHHAERAALYKVLRHLDSLVESKDTPENTEGQADYDKALGDILAALGLFDSV